LSSPESSLPTQEAAPAPASVEKPSFGTAFRYWLRLGFVNFGGPAGQIALMHDDLVERRRWISHERFMHALNYCMLLPGPEAQQLAVYVGWLLHGTFGGIVAGTLFILPGAVLILGLSILYSLYGEVGWVAGIFYGLGPAVAAVVAAAVLRVGKKSLSHPFLTGLAGAAFVSIFFLSVPFPAIVAAAILIGLAGARWRPAWFKSAAREHEGGRAAESPQVRPSLGRSARVFAAHLLLWGTPVLALGWTRGWSDNFAVLSIFFSIAAMVTFGGAYAVLAYVAQAAVFKYGWLTDREMTVGLGLAESTPGPLILTVQFVGYMAGFNHPPDGWSPVAAGVLGTALTLWVTFVPCFLWIFLGAPYIERLRGRPALDAALTAVTAAIVGVILNLAVWLALRVLFADVSVRRLGPLTLNVPAPATVDWAAVVLAAAGFVGILRFKWNMVAVVLGWAAVGLVYKLVWGGTHALTA
jgi:chromate transporter